MNERIRELAEQAGISTTDHGRGPFIDDYVSLGDLERFAQLIVSKCAGIYDKIDNGNSHMGTDNYLEALQKHFAVDKD